MTQDTPEFPDSSLPVGFHGELHLKNGHTVNIRKLAADDGPGIQAFFANLRPESARLFIPHSCTDEAVAERVNLAMQGDDWSYVGLADGEIVAYFFLWWVARPVPMLGIGIADAWQNSGLGRQLMSILIDDARNLGRDGITLTTMLDNDRAFHVYLDMGFIYLGDVEHPSVDGKTVVERNMFLPLKEGAVPPEHPD